MTAEVEQIIRYTEKGRPGEALRGARLLAGGGLEGDRHGGGVSLVAGESLDWLAARAGENGLCFNKFKANIVFRGAGMVRPDGRFAVGGTVLRAEGKRCYGECGLYRSGKPCGLAQSACVAEVELGGDIKVGDTIEA